MVNFEKPVTQPISDTKHRLKGIFVALAVVVTLIGAPIGSYIYLRKGFEYRLESIDQLKEKEVAPELKSFLNEHAPFIGNAQLVHFSGSTIDEELALIHQIDEQIVDRDRFEILSFTDQDGVEAKREIRFLGKPTYQPNMQFFLIDTSNIIRGVYEYREDLGKELIRHLSVVIPVPRSRSVILKRQGEED